MEKHLELKEKFDQLMKQDMDVSEHEQEWFELLNDMHEYLKDKTIPRNIRRQFEPLGMLEVTMKICDRCKWNWTICKDERRKMIIFKKWYKKWYTNQPLYTKIPHSMPTQSEGTS